ncbi:hypothetical protein N7520_004518 [Penicillium odoratum]|uniref:uncharacterized protein n=1 Tax=Penicillium odoratum TaxID=1167516 RepID=UPI00254942F4|nr:uncharacterized protein N7520_004518 [Penicillium odoratum]KAJ5764959.1 hypothetical protein N7520_004518 [Penicillium odoratum]
MLRVPKDRASPSSYGNNSPFSPGRRNAISRIPRPPSPSGNPDTGGPSITEDSDSSDYGDTTPLGPTVRMSLSANKVIMGDEAQSRCLPVITNESRSQGKFRPRIIQNSSPHSENFGRPGDDKTNTSFARSHNQYFPAGLSTTRPPSPDIITFAMLNGDRNIPDPISGVSPVMNPSSHLLPRLLPRPPPRTSSMNALTALHSHPVSPGEFDNDPIPAKSTGKRGTTAYDLTVAKSAGAIGTTAHDLTKARSVGMIGASESIKFEDICQSHPEMEGTVIQTGIIRVPATVPRVSRVMGGIRSAFTRSRSEKRAKSTLSQELFSEEPVPTFVLQPRLTKRSKSIALFDMVKVQPSVSAPPVPVPPVPTTPSGPTPNLETGSLKKKNPEWPLGRRAPMSTGESTNALKGPRSAPHKEGHPEATLWSSSLPPNSSGKLEEVKLDTTGLDSVRQTLNGLGRLLVEDEDVERRRVWYREFITLHNLLADFNSREAGIEEAGSLVAQMRAEASLRRYAMIVKVHQINKEHAGFYAGDLPSDRVVESWKSGDSEKCPLV